MFTYKYKRLPNLRLGVFNSLVCDIRLTYDLFVREYSTTMFSPRKIELLLALLSSIFLSFVKQTGITEIPSPASNSNISDMSATRKLSTKQEVSSCVFIINLLFIISIHLEINCI